MTVSTDLSGPGPFFRALARFGRRALGVLLLFVAIGLSTCHALVTADPYAAAPVIETLENAAGVEVAH